MVNKVENSLGIKKSTNNVKVIEYIVTVAIIKLYLLRLKTKVIAMDTTKIIIKPRSGATFSK